MFYQVENEKLVLKIFTAKLWDIYCREWFAGLQNNSPSDTPGSGTAPPFALPVAVRTKAFEDLGLADQGMMREK